MLVAGLGREPVSAYWSYGVKIIMTLDGVGSGHVTATTTSLLIYCVRILVHEVANQSYRKLKLRNILSTSVKSPYQRSLMTAAHYHDATIGRRIYPARKKYCLPNLVVLVSHVA